MLLSLTRARSFKFIPSKSKQWDFLQFVTISIKILIPWMKISSHIFRCNTFQKKFKIKLNTEIINFSRFFTHTLIFLLCIMHTKIASMVNLDIILERYLWVFKLSLIGLVCDVLVVRHNRPEKQQSIFMFFSILAFFFFSFQKLCSGEKICIYHSTNKYLPKVGHAFIAF